MTQGNNPPVPTTHETPGKPLTVILLAAAILLLGTAVALLLLSGPSFDSFPGRTIGISLLSNIDPHYRIGLFLFGSALLITVTWGAFTLSEHPLGWERRLPCNATTALLLSCLIGNGAATVIHPDTSLFLAGTAHSAAILLLWLVHRSRNRRLTAEQFILRLAIAWQTSTLALWLTGLDPNYLYYPLTLGLYLVLGRLQQSQWQQRAATGLVAALLIAPVLLIAAIEWAYFSHGTAATQSDVMVRIALLSALAIATGFAANPSGQRLAWLGAGAVLLTSFVINQYDNTVLYKGYDLFHLPEKLLPLQQWERFRSIPFIDYHPGHGAFDMLPHGAYQFFNQGNPLESLAWGNGYFIGWTVQALYIALMFATIARVFDTTSAFLLLWLLPVFHVLEPYNTLLLLPVLNLLTLPGSTHPLWRWALQWAITLALAIWRADFGMIVLAGNLIAAVSMAWYHRRWRPLGHCVLCLAIYAALLALWGISGDTELLSDRLKRTGDLMQIQLLAAAYDHFYKEWNYMGWIQYVAMPLMGALVGGYSLARVYLRRDLHQFGLHLAIIFVTAIGFALSIRLFQRHSLAEGVSKSNFFYFAPVLLVATLHIRRAWQGPVAAVLIMVTFLMTPKTDVYREGSPWSPRHSYPVTTHAAEFPELTSVHARLEDRVTKYDSFVDFSQHYLRDNDAFYDFANAPMLYQLADIKLPTYVYETVWHTSENIQDDTLLELEARRSEGELPFIVFRQGKPRWDSLDGVDNALRSYKVAEYIYNNYRPCVRVFRFDIWTDKRLSCDDSLARRIPEGAIALRDSEPLPRDYLKQYLEFGHLAYIWANYDTLDDPVTSNTDLEITLLPSGVYNFQGANRTSCRRSACYLDLQVSSEQTAVAQLRLNGRKLASFTLRPGKHQYRLRLSAAYRWHQAIGGSMLHMKTDVPVTAHKASLVQLAAPGSG